MRALGKEAIAMKESINQSINVKLVSFYWTLTPIVQEDENHSSLQISAENVLKEVST